MFCLEGRHVNWLVIDRLAGVEGMPIEGATEARQVDLAVTQGGIQTAPLAPV